MKKSFFNSVESSEKHGCKGFLPEPVRWAEALDWRCRKREGGDGR